MLLQPDLGVGNRRRLDAGAGRAASKAKCGRWPVKAGQTGGRVRVAARLAAGGIHAYARNRRGGSEADPVSNRSPRSDRLRGGRAAGFVLVSY
ncbi:hypothetical protein [Azospirillum argentinense]